MVKDAIWVKNMEGVIILFYHVVMAAILFLPRGDDRHLV
jgi:hypothetical protein